MFKFLEDSNLKGQPNCFSYSSDSDSRDCDSSDSDSSVSGSSGSDSIDGGINDSNRCKYKLLSRQIGRLWYL